jgi:hypothetical protein
MSVALWKKQDTFYLERKDSFRPVNDRTEDLQDFEAQDVKYMYKTR